MYWTCRDIVRYELQLKPTGEVEQYSASATYELQREDQASVDTLKFLVKAEGEYPRLGCSITASVCLGFRTHKKDIFMVTHFTSISRVPSSCQAFP